MACKCKVHGLLGEISFIINKKEISFINNKEISYYCSTFKQTAFHTLCILRHPTCRV
jgi:hypothetical protein